MLHQYIPDSVISIHALREEGDYRAMGWPSGSGAISIHALREEGDESKTASVSGPWIFLSTPSARRATKYKDMIAARMKHFYPRPPRGGRLRTTLAEFRARVISIHALREEGDMR